jgi:hypothetical protein
LNHSGCVDLDHWTGRSLADLARECDAIRAARPLPDEALLDLLDDMADAAARIPKLSCSTRSDLGLPVCGTCAWCAKAPERQAKKARNFQAWRARRKASREP